LLQSFSKDHEVRPVSNFKTCDLSPTSSSSSLAEAEIDEIEKFGAQVDSNPQTEAEISIGIFEATGNSRDEMAEEDDQVSML
jgi:hypothetical protein